MTRDFERRLRKLESQLLRHPTEQEKNEKRLQLFLACAVAYYLGDPTPEDSIAEAYMRALGYSNSHEYRNATFPDRQERVLLARSKLLEKFGVSWEHESKEISEAF